MTEDLLTLRTLVVSRDEGLHDLFRQAVAAATVPIEMVDAADAASASNCLAGNDLAYLDGALPSEEITQIAHSLRKAEKPAFSIHLATGAAAVAFATDAVAGRPTRPEDTQWLLERSIRARLPSRVLVVDDSATMRSIVRKALMATRFPFHISEAGEGFTALNMVRGGEFDLIFLDYNMPGFSGLETLAEIKRAPADVGVVMITSNTDETLARRAREMGAAFLKKPFFPTDIENVLCGYYGLRALYPKGN
jgi:CheY-like chemotaxis protein